MKDKKVVLTTPDWVRDIKDDNIAGAIVGLLFGWAWDGKTKEIPNLREYVASKYDDMSDDEVTEICDLLIEHKVVK